jgi:tetratricopeptide (TPR) repeat protein
MDEALKVHPLVPAAWYLKGIACMRIDRFEEGIEAFSRCVQQDMEIGEAWANMGAIYMHTKCYTKAYSALSEARKHKRDSWQVLENLMNCSLSMGKYTDTVSHMNALLDQNMRLKSQRPIHTEELGKLCAVAVHESLCASGMTESELESNKKPIALTKLAQSTEKLLSKMVNVVSNDEKVWEVTAYFYDALRYFGKAIEYRTKEFRTLLTHTGWEKDSLAIDAVAKAAKELVCAHQKDVNVAKSTVYAAKSLLQTAQRTFDSSTAPPRDHPGLDMSSLVEELDALHTTAK